MLDNHDIALGRNRPELVAGASEEPGEVVCHERHDGFTIEVIRPTWRPSILRPTESQRDLCRRAGAGEIRTSSPFLGRPGADDRGETHGIGK